MCRSVFIGGPVNGGENSIKLCARFTDLAPSHSSIAAAPDECITPAGWIGSPCAY
jgi:hypothetical protein